MVTTLKNLDRPQPPAWHARFTRRNTTLKQIQNQKPLLRYKRARIYAAQLGRFISRDPIGYVDGMSFYRAYFVPTAVDPLGQFIAAVNPNDEISWISGDPISKKCKEGCTLRIRSYPQWGGGCGHGHAGLILDPNCNPLNTAAGGGATTIDGDAFNDLVVVPNCKVGIGLPKKEFGLPNPTHLNPFRPSDIYVRSLTPDQCACLEGSKAAWDAVPADQKIRDDINRNSNWVAKCILKRCRITINWGWFMTPTGWNGTRPDCEQECPDGFNPN